MKIKAIFEKFMLKIELSIGESGRCRLTYFMLKRGLIYKYQSRQIELKDFIKFFDIDREWF